MNRITALCATAVLAASASAEIILAESRFDTSSHANDLWISTGDTWPDGVPTRTGGYLSVTEQPCGITMFFIAPQKFLGDKSSAYGHTLEFDLRIVNGLGIYSTTNDVQLWGDGLSLQADAGPIPSIYPDWTPYRVSLHESTWIDRATDLPATESQLRRVLTNLEVIAIRAEYRDANGGEETHLDNVVLYGACPPNAADLDRDGVVGLQDLALMLAAFGWACTP